MPALESIVNICLLAIFAVCIACSAFCANSIGGDKVTTPVAAYTSSRVKGKCETSSTYCRCAKTAAIGEIETVNTSEDTTSEWIGAFTASCKKLRGYCCTRSASAGEWVDVFWLVTVTVIVCA